MKDSVRILRTLVVGLLLAVAAFAAAACAKSSKAKDVAQDSILVKDAGIAEHKTDTTSGPATLVRDRGSAADRPTLTSGAPVKRSPATNAGASQTGLQPPVRVNPTPVLPSRESTSAPQRTPTPNPTLVPQPAMTPSPVIQPASPKPPVVIQPSPVPKRDSSTDSLRVL
jgi:hypothetical protein